MAEDSKIILSSEDQSLGTIEVAPRVVEIIAGVAASEIDGVSKMYGSLANSFVNYQDGLISVVELS